MVRFRVSNNINFSQEKMCWGWLGIKPRILELFSGNLFGRLLYVHKHK